MPNNKTIDQDGDVTGLLLAWRGGEAGAADGLMQRLADRLHRLAAGFLNRERENHTLQTTELVHEAYLRLREQDVEWESREHFLAITGRMMRRILVDQARRRQSAKWGGGMERLSEDTLEGKAVAERAPELLALDEALEALDRENPEVTEVLKLRYFVGLTGDEIATRLGISRPTVQRRLRHAKSWLEDFLGPESCG